MSPRRSSQHCWPAAHQERGRVQGPTHAALKETYGVRSKNNRYHFAERDLPLNCIHVRSDRNKVVSDLCPIFWPHAILVEMGFYGEILVEEPGPGFASTVSYHAILGRGDLHGQVHVFPQLVRFPPLSILQGNQVAVDDIEKSHLGEDLSAFWTTTTELGVEFPLRDDTVCAFVVVHMVSTWHHEQGLTSLEWIQADCARLRPPLSLAIMNMALDYFGLRLQHCRGRLEEILFYTWEVTFWYDHVLSLSSSLFRYFQMSRMKVMFGHCS